jgi:hypothetical protein
MHQNYLYFSFLLLDKNKKKLKIENIIEYIKLKPIIFTPTAALPPIAPSNLNNK